MVAGGELLNCVAEFLEYAGGFKEFQNFRFKEFQGGFLRASEEFLNSLIGGFAVHRSTQADVRFCFSVL